MMIDEEVMMTMTMSVVVDDDRDHNGDERVSCCRVVNG